jgi:5-methylcytosine-specific restriction protein A
MPLSAPRPCSTPGCPELVRGRARCEGHTRQAEAQRGTAAERGYGRRWQAARRSFLSRPENALCRPCQKKTPPRVTAATVADHITAHKGDQVLFWDENNWQPSCKDCHDARVDEGDFGRSS